MNDEQFDKHMKALNEIAWLIMATGLGLAIIVTMIGLTIVDLLR